jgi:hypothetical protein
MAVRLLLPRWLQPDCPAGLFQVVHRLRDTGTRWHNSLLCRAAAKLLTAVMHSYPDQVSDIYTKAAPELVARFREREENVKADVFGAYCHLLRQVRYSPGRGLCPGPAQRITPPLPEEMAATSGCLCQACLAVVLLPCSLGPPLQLVLLITGC